LARENRLIKDEAVSTEEELRRQSEELEAQLGDSAREADGAERARTQRLRRSYMLTVRAPASAVEARDAYAGRHDERVAAYGLRLADVLQMRIGDEPQIEFGFMLHDVGKLAVPNAIPFEPGPLTHAERSVIEQRPLDELTTNRPYRHASTIAQGRSSIVVKAAGSHLDPKVVDAFGSLPDEVIADLRREIG
jgi:HD-GYP domain-containing protein (c-di-GMP phosphodiesterase class II)